MTYSRESNIQALFNGGQIEPHYLESLLARSEPHADGLTSIILRAPVPEHVAQQQWDAVPGWLALKRVIREDERKPHSILKEIDMLRLANQDGATNIVPLLAAFQSKADEWSTMVTLVQPLYPLTLADALSAAPHDETEKSSVAMLLGAEALSISPTSSQFRLIVAKGLLSGLAHLHALSIAHRDIKPSNILLTHQGTVRLADFGTAWHSTSSSRTLTMQVGTGPWRAPELMFSPSDGYDACKADIWSAGATLAGFWTRSRQVPKRGPTPQQDYVPALQDWQRALESNEAWGELDTDESTRDPGRWEINDIEEDQESSLSGWSRDTLFDQRGDIALIGSIFELLGRPIDAEAWPEASTFVPPLHRMPFMSRDPLPGGLRQRLLGTGYAKLDSIDESIMRFCDSALQLSAAHRPSAEAALQLMSS